jgi:hypothetical protein
MLNLISPPVCGIAEAPARLVAFANSSELAAGAAAVLLAAGLVACASRRGRRLLGQALLFAGLGFGTLPIVSLLVAGLADCGNPEMLARLARVLPVLSMLAIGILAACAAGALLMLVRYVSASAPPARA